MFAKSPCWLPSSSWYLTPALRIAVPVPLPFLPPPFPWPHGRRGQAPQPDVQNYCETALPDTIRVLSCLQANRRCITLRATVFLVSARSVIPGVSARPSLRPPRPQPRNHRACHS